MDKQKFKNILFDILRKKIGLILKFWPIDRVLNKGKKYAENVHQKLVSDPFLISENSTKQPTALSKSL